MVVAKGFTGIAGVVAESTVWGTEAVVTERVPFRSESITDAFEKIAEVTLEGKAGMQPSSQGPKTVAGTLPTNFRYSTNEQLVTNYFGAKSTVGVYSMIESLIGVSVTLAIEKTVSVWTYTGVKCVGWELTGNPSDQIQSNYTLAMKDVIRNSTVNETSDLAGLASTANNMLFTDLNFRIGDLSTSLSTANEMGVSEFTLTMTRPMDSTFTNQQQTVIEPLENERRTGVLNITIPRYTVDTFQTWKDADTRLQARLYFENPNSTGQTKEILLPEMTIQTVDSQIPGPALVPVNVVLDCYRNVSNTTMATGEVEIQMTVTPT